MSVNRKKALENWDFIIRKRCKWIKNVKNYLKYFFIN